MRPLKSFESSQDYARGALILIIRKRFQAFIEKFEREPDSHEPLFFDESETVPVQADAATVTKQLQTAARLARVQAAPVFTFLGLAPLPKNKVRSWLAGSQKVGGHSADCSHREALVKSPVWTRFLADKRLHHRHRITARELKLVAGASFMGEITKMKDILLVLDIIRGSKRKARKPRS